MSKYNEIMEHIELTDEMRERIISNVSAKQKRRRISRMISAALGAAACIVVVFGAVTVMKNTDSMNKKPDKPTVNEQLTSTPIVDDTLTYGGTSYNSAAELSKDFGVEIHDISKLPFDVMNASYSIMFDSFAEADYYGKNGEDCCFRVGKDTENITGEYYEFTTVETEKLSGIDITLKGYGDSYHIASWVKDGHFYSVSLSRGTDKDNLLEIADEVMN